MLVSHHHYVHQLYEVMLMPCGRRADSSESASWRWKRKWDVWIRCIRLVNGCQRVKRGLDVFVCLFSADALSSAMMCARLQCLKPVTISELLFRNNGSLNFFLLLQCGSTSFRMGYGVCPACLVTVKARSKKWKQCSTVSITG
ncbi:hypothetical protein VPH35_048057 [Triticum aestivum]